MTGIGVSLEGKVIEADAGDGIGVERRHRGAIGIELVRIQVVQDNRLFRELVHEHFLSSCFQFYILVVYLVPLPVELEVVVTRHGGKEQAGAGGRSVGISAVDGQLAHARGAAHQDTVQEDGVDGVVGVHGNGFNIRDLEQGHVVDRNFRSER